jgi:hypothetical protein
MVSPDGRWWWNGVQWVPVNPAPMPPPPGYPPYAQPAPFEWKPSPGLRPFLLVMLVLADLVTGAFALFGLLALSQELGLFGPQGSTRLDAGGFIFIGVAGLLFALMLAATLGVALRTAWARVVAIVAGVVISLTCLGVVLGIPIVVAASRAPIRRPVATWP